MKRSIIRLFALSICLFLAGKATAQLSKYAGEIWEFQKQDSVRMAAPHSILLIGSSSFRLWSDVQSYFPGYPIVNRAFGGSTLPEVSEYAQANIARYQPKQVVIYCGENDLASSDSVTSKMVFNRFKALYQIIRDRCGKINITYVSIKPSPVRKRLQLKAEEANALISNFLKKQPFSAFVDVYHPMLKKGREINGEIFRSDSLHMNPKGYAIWQKILLPYLVK